MKKLISFLIFFGVSVAFHQQIMEFALKMGLSYTYSMILPYIIEFTFACLVLVKVNQLFLGRATRWMRRIVNLVVLGGLCGIAFAANVIYDGDFNNTYNIVTVSGPSFETFEPGLTMIALPGCGHCRERATELKMMSKFFPETPMHIAIVGGEEYAIQDYQELAGEFVRIYVFPESLRMNSAIVTGEYPVLFHKSWENSNELKRWSNQGFGSAAWDMIIKER